MIEFDAVTKRYPDGTTAVEHFDFQIRPRETTVFLGSSGCGKTTLLRMINRMVDPSSGSIRIDDADIAEKNPVELRRSIGYVLQHGGLLPHVKVLDNIAAVPKLRGSDAKDARARALKMMDVVGLDRDFAGRYPAQLSGGQQQRVGVARALAGDPNILLMDEPFGAVDPIVRAELQTEVKRLQDELSKTIVFVTHDIDEALLLGDQVVILSTGAHIEQAGTPRDIVSAPANDFVRDFTARWHRRGELLSGQGEEKKNV